MEYFKSTTKKGKLILSAVIVGTGVVFMAGSMVAVALPTIQSAFDAAINQIQWVMNAYVLMLAAFLLLGGALGDRYGRRRLYLIGIVVFIVGSVLAAFAAGISQLIIYQGIIGLGAAIMVPGSLAIINACFAKEHRGKVIGIWAGVSGGVAALGPFLGGFLVDTFGWSTIFWVNIPMALLAFFLTYLFVPQSYDKTAGNPDWLSTFFLVLGLFGVAFTLIQGPVSGWTEMSVVLSAAVGVFALVIFVIIQKRSKKPMIPLEIFKKKTVLSANLSTLLVYFSFNGLIFFLVLTLQQILGFSATATGLALLPPIVLITFLAAYGGTLADRFGAKPQMVWGALIIALGLIVFAFPFEEISYFKHYLPGLIIFGIGMAFMIAPLTRAALKVEDRYSGVASGINNAVSRLGALLAVAILGAVMVSFFGSDLKEKISASSLDFSEKEAILGQRDKLGGIELPVGLGVEEKLESRIIISESFLFGFRVIMAISAFLVFLASLISFFLIPSRHSVREVSSGHLPHGGH